MSNAHVASKEQEEATKMLGAHVPQSIYWEFKRVAAERQEMLQEAILHAAMLYIDAVPQNKEEEQEGNNVGSEQSADLRLCK